MRPLAFLPSRAVAQPRHENCRQGRDCELSRRASACVLFPRQGGLPGAWLLLLAGVCSFVAVRALELGPF